ncbi:hypothetical protein BC938DRAFT_477590, partial [Jimgerdemannia flammicorona]
SKRSSDYQSIGRLVRGDDHVRHFVCRDLRPDQIRQSSGQRTCKLPFIRHGIPDARQIFNWVSMDDVQGFLF